MNIFELTRILNEASKIAHAISNEILDYDNRIEKSNPSNPQAKAKKTKFFKKIKNIIEDEVNENSVRNKMFNTLRDNNFIRGKKSLQSTISTIQNILQQSNENTLIKLENKIGVTELQPQRGSVLFDLQLDKSQNIIHQLKNFRPYGCGPWEAFFGLFYNAKKADSKGDIVIGDSIYEVKLSNKGYIDTKKVNVEYQRWVEKGFVGDERLKKLEIYLNNKNEKAQLLVIDGNGNYIIINKNNYQKLYNDRIITINHNAKGEGTDFGVLSICYNVK